jgi:hypothetical protein
MFTFGNVLASKNERPANTSYQRGWNDAEEDIKSNPQFDWQLERKVATELLTKSRGYFQGVIDCIDSHS